MKKEQEIWTIYHERWLVNQSGPIKLLAVYEVSDQGRIRINGKIKELPNIPNNDFYLGAPASYNGKRMRLHQLVATIYVHNDDPINNTQIDHIDGNKANNRADNLRWVSPKQNMSNPVTKTKMEEIWSSEECKNKRSIASKKNWEREDYRENVSKHNKETKNTPEYKQKVKDYWESEEGIEQKKNLSEQFSGENNPMYGKNCEDFMTPEAIELKRKRMKESQNRPETKALKSKKMKGKPNKNKGKRGIYTEEQLERISKGTSDAMKSLGFKWIYKDNKRHFVQTKELQKWLDDGWELGRKKKKQI